MERPLFFPFEAKLCGASGKKGAFCAPFFPGVVLTWVEWEERGVIG